MNFIEKSIFDETKTNQKLMNTSKIVISLILIVLFWFLFFLNGNMVSKVIAYFLVCYVIIYTVLRFLFERFFSYYKYISTSIDILWILFLVYGITTYSEWIVVSLYFIPFLLTIIVISGLLFQIFYTFSVGLFSIFISIYLLSFDGLLDKYSIIPIFFISIIYLVSLYSSSNLKRIIQKISNLKQLERYTDTGLLQAIESNPDTLNQGWIEKELVIMFLDIRGFSKISENMEASEIFGVLNKYLGSFATLVEENSWTFDKYIGDCIMCHFDGESKVQNSYTTALKILEKLHQLQKNSGYKISIWIGIHIGNVYAGSLGNENRMDHTIIGDNVNIASRLESLTREIWSDIVVSKDYFDAIDFETDFEFAGNYHLKGKDHTIDVYKM